MRSTRRRFVSAGATGLSVLVGYVGARTMRERFEPPLRLTAMRHVKARAVLTPYETVQRRIGKAACYKANCEFGDGWEAVTDLVWKNASPDASVETIKQAAVDARVAAEPHIARGICARFGISAAELNTINKHFYDIECKKMHAALL